MKLDTAKYLNFGGEYRQSGNPGRKPKGIRNQIRGKKAQ